MTTVNIYLTFDGNCKEAFDFYRSVLGGEFSYVGTFREMPSHEGMPPLPEKDLDKIMHISLRINDNSTIFGSDSGGEWASDVKQGNNFSISVNTNTEEEAKKIFDGLAAGGRVNMPLEKTFWQAYFGMLQDKFGVNWMINCELEAHEQFEKDNKPV